MPRAGRLHTWGGTRVSNTHAGSGNEISGSWRKHAPAKINIARFTYLGAHKEHQNPHQGQVSFFSSDLTMVLFKKEGGSVQTPCEEACRG